MGWAGNPSFSNVCGQAVAAGLHILQAVNQLNQHLDMLMDNLVGKVGDRRRQVITAIGDAVNWYPVVTVWEQVAERATLVSQHRLKLSGKAGE
ncbi:MAG: hypothetical protein ACK4QL_03755 [Pseudanabaenaceae cyanobacterium]